MTIKNLSQVSFEKIIECFLKAFENYFVPLPSDKDYYRRRWSVAKVDYRYSYGMFDSDRLVGFVIHAIDVRNGKLTAFNTGTGVIPEYRGRRIVQSIYQFAIKDLLEKGVECSRLEVITENKAAISLYKHLGFQICRDYKCFKGQIEINQHFQVELREKDLMNVNWDILPNQQFYSWDHQKECIINGKYKFFEVLFEGKLESFFIMKPQQSYLAQFDILEKSNSCWKRLFQAIKEYSPSIKVNNIDVRLEDKLRSVVSVGLENIVDQFEMEMNIVSS